MTATVTVLFEMDSAPLWHCGSLLSSFSSGVLLPWQSVVCGHGTRYRNLSCFVSDGSSDGEGSQVDEELCSSLELAVDGDKQIRLKEACVLPCPGNNAVPTVIFSSFLWLMGNLVKLYIEYKQNFYGNKVCMKCVPFSDMFTLFLCVSLCPTINCATAR